MYHFWAKKIVKREIQFIGERGCKWYSHCCITEDIWIYKDVWFHVVVLPANANFFFYVVLI